MFLKTIYKVKSYQLFQHRRSLLRTIRSKDGSFAQSPLCVHAWAGMHVTRGCTPTGVCSSNGEISSVYLCSSPASPPPITKKWGNHFCSSVQPSLAPPPLPGRKESLGESYSHIKTRNRTLSSGNSLGEVTFPS